MFTDIATIIGLVGLEGILSVDNAIVLAVLVHHLPDPHRKRALTYGIAGAFLFRAVSLFFITWLIQSYWIQILGGLYLLFLTAKHFKGEEDEGIENPPCPSFWKTVLMVELMDIVFSIDSILSAVAVSQKFYIVLAGGILGIIMMRFAANIVTKILDRAPWLIHLAYIIIGIAGLRLVSEGVGHYELYRILG